MWETIKTPAYVVDEKKLRENLECLHRVEEETGCHILLAQKAFSMFRVYPLIGSYLSGTTASGLYEARLGYEEMKKENQGSFCVIFKSAVSFAFTALEMLLTQANTALTAKKMLTDFHSEILSVL